MTTYGEGSFSANGDATNWASTLFKEIAARLAPKSLS
jgi:hypothetical protein